jgi:cold shock CspA family protein/ribosome-associated translation inhibitor RaiA
MEIHWVDCQDLREDIREGAEQRIRALAEGRTDLIDVRFTAHTTGHHRLGNQEIRITAQLRGKEVVAARTRDELGRALDEALDVFEREVRSLRGQRRSHRTESEPEPPELGIVDRVVPENDHGFILTDAGDRVYFHRNAVKHGLDFGDLGEGDRVALNLEAGDEGLQATVVYPAPPDLPTP